MSTLISIVIPVFNRKEVLRRTVLSVLAQTYTNIEVIVVDDGSSEDIQSVLTDFLEKPNFRLVRQSNGGAPRARNVGLALAKGEYVVFLDADIVCDKNMLQKMFGTLQNHPEASYVYCSYILGHKKIIPGDFSAKRLRQLNYIHSSAMIRRKALSAQPWDESLKRFQDWDLWLTLLQQGSEGVFLSEFLQTIVPNKQGISSWLPAFAYRAPWKYLPYLRSRVQAYEELRQVVINKHGLMA